MQKLVLTLLFALVASAFSMQGQTNPKPPTEGGNETIVLRPPNPPKVKRSVSKIVIECSYANGVLYFMPADFYEILEVTIHIEDNGEKWTEIISNDNNSILLEEGVSYKIIAKTPEGQIFIGYIN